MATVIGNLSVVVGLSGAKLFSGLDAMQRGLSSFGAAVGSIGVKAEGFQGIGLAVAGGIVSTGQAAIKAAADYESLEIAFTSLAGGAKEAKALLADLSNFAAATPFEFTDLTRATQTLMAYGFEAKQAFGIVARMGDVASASTTGQADGLNRIAVALGQIQALSITHTQELKQLAEVGINAFDAVAKKLGVSTATAMKMIELGQVDAATGIQAILDLATSPKYAGLMARQAQSVNGLFSTLRDNVGMMMRDLGQILIEGFSVKDTQKAFIELTGTLREQLVSLRPMLLNIGAAFGAIRDIGVAAFSALTATIAGWVKQIDASAERLGGIRTAIVEFAKTVTQGIVNAVSWLTGKLAGMFESIAWIKFFPGTRFETNLFDRSSFESMINMAQELRSISIEIARPAGVGGGIEQFFDKVKANLPAVQDAAKAIAAMAAGNPLAALAGAAAIQPPAPFVPPPLDLGKAAGDAAQKALGELKLGARLDVGSSEAALALGRDMIRRQEEGGPGGMSLPAKQLDVARKILDKVNGVVGLGQDLLAAFQGNKVAVIEG